jgi:acetyl-CoA synthase
MPDTLAQSGEKGSRAILSLARKSLGKAIVEYVKDAKIYFPETSHYLPLINALLNIKVKNLSDLSIALKEAENLNFIPYLGSLLNKGIVTLLCEEILAALALLNKEHPKGGVGFIPDKILRSLVFQLVDGRISGIAVILGPAKDEDSAVTLIRDLQSKGIISFLAGNINGNTLEGQLKNKEVGLGLENYIVPLGSDYLSVIYAINFLVRVPLIYGNLKPKEWERIADYIRNRVPAFVLLLGHIDEEIAAIGLGALAFSLPIITDLGLPRLGNIDAALFKSPVIEKDYKKIASQCILTRGIKIKVSKVDIPVPYASAFEGERVRREDLQVEFGGKSGLSFEFLTSEKEDGVEDGNIEIIGPDIDQLGGRDSSLPLAIIVNVFGCKMQKDFEPVLEYQIHRLINYAFGVGHAGQRDMNWIRVSREAFLRGFRLRHIGVILHAMLHQEYGAIVDKAQVKLYTRREDVERLFIKAQEVFNLRDERLNGMTDESVDTYYSCLICQSLAPNHVCIITPQRPGLCGAYSWLGAKASFEIEPTGANQPIFKGKALDDRLGQWDNINKFAEDKSNKTISKVSLYSLLDSPHSSCGCFECIVAVVPEANGVMVVNRDYLGITPLGMSFATLADLLGAGVQTPGFLGISKLYILSRKFILAEGGLKRLVWMPKELKELLGKRLRSIARDIGEPDLLEKIADEGVARTLEELLNFLLKVKHPTLCMDSLI